MDNGDILENNEEFLNNINSTLNVKRDYDMKELDYEWIDIIEDVLPYLDNILRNPKRFIVNDEEIVKVELARKVTVESVIHLTQHTNFIQKIDKNLNDYDEIIIGTPVWWYTIAPVIRTFFTQNDLSNKTIKPFATNAGWLGHTFQEIQKLCPNSKVDKGMNIVFESYSDNLVTSPDEIEKWIDEL